MSDVGNDTVASCPDDVLRNLPWYHDESLDDDTRGRIEAHAAECSSCRNELSWVSGDVEDADAEAPTSGAPNSDRVYAMVQERIEAGEQSLQPAQVQAARRQSTWRQVALAASVVAALMAGFLAGRGLEDPALQAGGAENPFYESATGPEETRASGPQLDVIFALDVSIDRINDALRGIGGEFVAGPSRLGVYRVELSEDADANAAARLLRSEGEGVATLAEVVDP